MCLQDEPVLFGSERADVVGPAMLVIFTRGTVKACKRVNADIKPNPPRRLSITPVLLLPSDLYLLVSASESDPELSISSRDSLLS